MVATRMFVQAIGPAGDVVGALTGDVAGDVVQPPAARTLGCALKRPPPDNVAPVAPVPGRIQREEPTAPNTPTSISDALESPTEGWPSHGALFSKAAPLARYGRRNPYMINGAFGWKLRNWAGPNPPASWAKIMK